jgi:predicted AAA+ superfamily ATPase
MRLLSQLRARTGLELALRVLFEQPTVAGVAQALDQVQAEAQALAASGAVSASRPTIIAGLGVLNPDADGTQRVLSYGQIRLWTLAQIEGASGNYNMPAALKLSGALQSQALALALRDVIERHEVTNVTALRWMVRRLLGNPAGHFSITKFAADLKSQGVPVGREMLYQFLEQLEDTFLVASLPLATDSEKRRQVNPRKIYPVDMGLIPVFDRSLKANLGHALEVAVFQELQRRGYKTGYWKTASGFEVDFVVTTSAGGRELIQVCTSLDDPETREREVRALEEGRVECPEARAFVLTLESRLPYPEVPRGIRVMPAWEWILRGDSSSG